MVITSSVRMCRVRDFPGSEPGSEKVTVRPSLRGRVSMMLPEKYAYTVIARCS